MGSVDDSAHCVGDTHTGDSSGSGTDHLLAEQSANHGGRRCHDRASFPTETALELSQVLAVYEISDSC